MIALTATNQILEISTGSATNIDVTVSFVDHTTTGGTLGTQDTLITTATNTTILSAPASSTQRQVKMISINNTGTASNEIIVKKDIGGTEYDIIRVVLAQNERLEYMDNIGWETYANSGGKKTTINQGNSPTSSSISTVVLGADVINNNAVANTLQDVTGLSIPVINGKTYWFKFICRYDANATTTGSRWTVGGVSISSISYTSTYPISTTAQTLNFANAIDLPTASNASSAFTSGNIAIIQGIVTASADGNLICRFASELANLAITAKAGSAGYYQQLD